MFRWTDWHLVVAGITLAALVSACSVDNADTDTSASAPAESGTEEAPDLAEAPVGPGNSYNPCELVNTGEVGEIMNDDAAYEAPQSSERSYLADYSFTKVTCTYTPVDYFDCENCMVSVAVTVGDGDIDEYWQMELDLSGERLWQSYDVDGLGDAAIFRANRVTNDVASLAVLTGNAVLTTTVSNATDTDQKLGNLRELTELALSRM